MTVAQRYEGEVIPGVCSMLGGASVLGAPLVYRNQSLSVLSGVLPPKSSSAAWPMPMRR
jgi:precorrin-2/cobalt-factor-2 C20-methyltransferase